MPGPHLDQTNKATVSGGSSALLPSEFLYEPGTMAYSGPMTNASGTTDEPSAGDPLPPECSVIEVHVAAN